MKKFKLTSFLIVSCLGIFTLLATTNALGQDKVRPNISQNSKYKLKKRTVTKSSTKTLQNKTETKQVASKAQIKPAHKLPVVGEKRVAVKNVDKDSNQIQHKTIEIPLRDPQKYQSRIYKTSQNAKPNNSKESNQLSYMERIEKMTKTQRDKAYQQIETKRSQADVGSDRYIDLTEILEHIESLK